jgi:hypothetical protein
MSKAILQQAKALINELSNTEKAQLVEWLGSALGRELMVTTTPITKEEQAPYATQIDRDDTVIPDNNAELQYEIPWKERPWTEEEIQTLIRRGESKTGAEIAAWLRANPDTGDWTAMDIPDVVEWVRQLRHQISTSWERRE